MKISVKNHLGITASIGITTFTAVAFAAVAFANSPPKLRDSRSNLKQLGTALMMYAQDYADVLPPMKDATTVRQLLAEYLEDDEAFINHQTQKPYAINLSLSGRSLNSLYKEGYLKGEGIIAFYEATPRIHGGRFVLRIAKPYAYVSGMPAWAYSTPNPPLWQPTVESVSYFQWPKAKKTSDLP